jgi:hypothetical protein
VVRREFDDTRRARLNIISHLVQHRLQGFAAAEDKLPKRQKPGSSWDPNYPHKYVEQKY